MAAIVFCSSNFGFHSSIVVIRLQLDTAIRDVSHEAKFVASQVGSRSDRHGKGVVCGRVLLLWDVSVWLGGK
jgi:hypothetical protein